MASTHVIRAQELQDCPIEDLALNRARSAALAQGDCMTRGRFADLYRVRVIRKGILNVRLTTDKFKPEVIIAAEGGRRIASSMSLESRWNLSPGSYIIYVTTSMVGGSGAYSIRAMVLDACPTTKLDMNSHRASVLSSECRNLNGEPEHRYSFVLDQPGRVSAELSTGLPRAYVAIWGADNEPIAGGTRQLVTVPLATGTYSLTVKTRDNSTGPYSLRLRGPCRTEPLELVGRASGEITTDDCRVSEVFLDSTDASYSKQFRIRVVTRGILDLRLRSVSGAISMSVSQGRGTPLTEATVSPSDAEVVVRLPLQPATYDVRLSSKALARYVLNSTFEGRPCVTQMLAIGVTNRHTFSQADCSGGEILPFLPTASLATAYKLNVDEMAEVNVRSEVGSGQMRIFDSELRPIKSGVFTALGNGGTSARLTPGSYYLLLEALGGRGSAYSMEVRRWECPIERIVLNADITTTFGENACISGSARSRKFGFALDARHTVSIGATQSDRSLPIVISNLSGSKTTVLKQSAASRVTGILDAGEYIIEVTSSGGAAADCSLHTAACPIANLVLNGVWQLESANLLNTATCEGGSARRYLISVNTPRSLSLEGRASDGDISAQLLTAELSPYGPATAPGRSFNLVRRLPAGNYVLEIRRIGPAVGGYRLRATTR